MSNLLEEIQQVISNELERINKTQLNIHSPHEAYAVIKEKCECANEKFRQTKRFVKEFWKGVKEENVAYYAEALMATGDCAIECAVEVIRVAIAAQKTIECIDKANAPIGEQ